MTKRYTIQINEAQREALVRFLDGEHINPAVVKDLSFHFAALDEMAAMHPGETIDLASRGDAAAYLYEADGTVTTLSA